ncbi:MAG: DUF2306 domain-containing protein [Acidobacteriota bacterium]|nr:DUF2306 domain-containing protein [Acidobacteriota bacterium]
MGRIVFSEIGLIHLIASIIALIAGTLVLSAAKGTKFHKTVGYVYAASMTILIVTAFCIYRLFGGFGIFHVAAIVSALTLAGGVVPAILRRPRKTWLGLHYSFMFWSVVGLYAAFVSEIMTRVPGLRFYSWLAISIAAVMTAGYLIFFFYKSRWQQLAKAYN